MVRNRLASLLLPALLLSGCSSLGGGTACTEAACAEGFQIDFSFTERGSWLFEVDIDGALTTCRATLPLPSGSASACDGSAVQLSLVGSALPAAQQSIGGINVVTSTAKRITVKASRDGAAVREKSFQPAWVESPGPNGPDCEPKVCRSAPSASF